MHLGLKLTRTYRNSLSHDDWSDKVKEFPPFLTILSSQNGNVIWSRQKYINYQINCHKALNKHHNRWSVSHSFTLSFHQQCEQVFFKTAVDRLPWDLELTSVSHRVNCLKFPLPVNRKTGHTGRFNVRKARWNNGTSVKIFFLWPTLSPNKI